MHSHGLRRPNAKKKTAGTFWKMVPRSGSGLSVYRGEPTSPAKLSHHQQFKKDIRLLFWMSIMYRVPGLDALVKKKMR